MGHVGNMGHVDFAYFCDNLMLLTIQKIKETIENDKEHFLLAGYSKDFEIWGFLLRIDEKLCCT